MRKLASILLFLLPTFAWWFFLHDCEPQASTAHERLDVHEEAWDGLFEDGEAVGRYEEMVDSIQDMPALQIAPCVYYSGRNKEDATYGFVLQHSYAYPHERYRDWEPLEDPVMLEVLQAFFDRYAHRFGYVKEKEDGR